MFPLGKVGEHGSTDQQKKKMVTFLQFDQLIKTLKELYSSFEKKEITIAKKDLNEIIFELKKLKWEVLPKRIDEVRSMVGPNGGEVKISSFELMEHNFRENSHSNVLRYIFDCELIGEIGAEILANFIFKIPDLKNIEWLSENILKRNYTIEREWVIEKGRIDLFIEDKINRFLIIIENKLLATVANKTEENDSVTKTQLTNYQEYANTSFYDGYTKVFILLSYRKLEEEYPPFVKVDYEYLNDVILKDNDSSDQILNDYKILLHSLSSPDKISLRKNLYKINNNKDLNTINLFEIESIKNELRWQKKTNLIA